MIEDNRERYIDPHRDLINVVRTAERKAEARAEARGRAEGRAQGRAEGRAQGRNEGIEETRKDNARRMKADGMDISLIAKYTGLSEEEINDLT